EGTPIRRPRPSRRRQASREPGGRRERRRRHPAPWGHRRDGRAPCAAPVEARPDPRPIVRLEADAAQEAPARRARGLRVDLRYSDEDEAFRAHARAWLRAHAPRSRRPPRGPASAEFDRAWQRKLYEHGWAGIAWPKDYGGRGLSALQEIIWY